MRERVHELGGTLEVTSDGFGTTVRAAVPLSVRPEAEHAKASAQAPI